ncbi:beta-ketoacyl-ACP reductase, putative [Ixodes scapularis]|uniref:Beta-ketoacyl-ACP reductase, putative n=1 Tax=Ixodes scapularis TaxID=6945 RepID=B7Q253_IXOSC|nr:beta-ketoacyl-ACP reductase, putative [Ixodes scapularis]|eukprot:XP_002410470.1 beta-ketoacyl-ACP reductase, putative [Ixodes scapularis]
MSLSGRLAIVTGGGSGIGRAVCYALADEGATVIVADIDGGAAGNTAVELPGEGHQALEVDVREMTSVLALFENVCDSCSTPVSIVVNSAGVIKASKVVEMEEDSFDDEVRTNLKVRLPVALKFPFSCPVPSSLILRIHSISTFITLYCPSFRSTIRVKGKEERNRN